MIFYSVSEEGEEGFLIFAEGPCQAAEYAAKNTWKSLNLTRPSTTYIVENLKTGEKFRFLMNFRQKLEVSMKWDRDYVAQK